MQLNRRFALGLGTASMLALSSAVRAAAAPAPRIIVQAAGRGDPAALLAALGSYAAAEMAAWGVPGMTMAVRGADGLRALLVLGQSDIERNLPVTPDQLFEIGSISKSLVALCLYRLAGQGRIKLDAPVASILTGVALTQPVTIAQLLEHSGGLAHDAPLFPRANGDKLWHGFAPGRRFSYSNTGYNLLGAVVAQVTGKTYPAAVRELVLQPLGMATALPANRSRDRARYAIGYTPQRGDLPWLPGALLAPAPWTDQDIPAGGIAATAADMLHYLDLLSTLSAGHGAGLMPDALARRFVTPTIDAPDFGPTARYAAGLAVIDNEGHACLHHTGGMIAFSSAVTFDPVADGGVFASSNIGGIDYRPRNITRYGCRLLAAQASGAALPPPPPIRVLAPVEKPERYFGTFIAVGGDTLRISGNGDGLALTGRGATAPLKPVGEGRFLTNHAILSPHELAFDKDDATGLWWGGTRFGRDAPAATPPVAEALRGYPGVYLSNDPWIGSASIVARGPTLVAEGAGDLERASDGSWRFTDPETVCERMWFDGALGGRMQRFSFSGNDMWRISDAQG